MPTRTQPSPWHAPHSRVRPNSTVGELLSMEEGGRIEARKEPGDVSTCPGKYQEGRKETRARGIGELSNGGKNSNGINPLVISPAPTRLRRKHPQFPSFTKENLFSGSWIHKPTYLTTLQQQQTFRSRMQSNNVEVVCFLLHI